MEKKTAPTNGLALAVQQLIQTQAMFLGQVAEMRRDMATIIAILQEHSRILGDHSRILGELPDAVRDKVGFKK